MFIDAKTIPKNTTINADVCIIGAGAAGITLAREFIGQRLEVCLLESGGLELDIETQSLYRGRSVGYPYLPIEATRLRYFGGTTNHWAGACRPLDPMDFEARDWVPHSGWPFGYDHLAPFYRRAHKVLELGPFTYSADEWLKSVVHPRLRVAAFDGQILKNAVLQKSPPTRFGEVYRSELERAANVRTYLNANVLEIETVEAGNAVRRLRVASLARNDFFVSAHAYVLAAGGIENARLLLLSDRANPNGVGNTNGLVGRFFMEHPNATWGKPGIVLPIDFPLHFYRTKVEVTFRAEQGQAPAVIWGFITPSERTLRRERLLNCGLAVQGVPEPEPDGVVSARHFKRSVQHGKWPDDFWEHVGNVVSDFSGIAAHSWYKLTGREQPVNKIELVYWSEQQPNPQSRVYLSNERDVFGQRRVVLDYRLTEQDYRTMRRVLELFGQELGRAGIGRLHIAPAVLNGEWESLFGPSFHHMGTTRMHVDPKQGVVDADCRLHEVANLYIAGSSVFPASGHANPTLTIVALALRLADHLKQTMKQTVKVT